MNELYNYGTNIYLERMVSKSILDNVQINYRNCIIIIFIIILAIIGVFIKIRNKRILCYTLAPILALCFLYGTYQYYYNKIVYGNVHYNFVTTMTDGSYKNVRGNTVSINNIQSEPGDVLIITDTKFKPYKLTDTEKEIYLQITLEGGIE